jgi:hypothetical protein
MPARKKKTKKFLWLRLLATFFFVNLIDDAVKHDK